jgi:XTP/dITP diphosphohydrolase
MNIWFATGNEHKKQELAGILAEHTVRIPSDAGIVFAPDETGGSFLENALIKAKALYEIAGEPVIADDSGLCVDALDGRPGIYSARYGSDDSKKLTASGRNALLLKELGNTPERKARFVCAMVLFLSKARFFVVQETLEGEISGEEWGAGGFGYDPIFFLPELGRTVAELSWEEKNRMSHRGKAGKAIGEFLQRECGVGIVS